MLFYMSRGGNVGLKYKENICQKIKEADRSLLNLLYPPRCPFCDRIAEDAQEVICPSCRKSICEAGEPVCKCCGKPLSDERREFCYDCGRKNHAFIQGKAMWVYEGRVRESVYRFKYRNKREYGGVYAKEIARRYGNWMRQRNVQALIPVPLHRNRRRARGYNQAEILADELGRITGIPVRRELLVRVQDTRPQKLLSGTERKNNLKKAFKTTKSIVQLNCVLIIDDIYTTGSTADAAASALQEAGVPEVYVCCVSIGKDC